MDIGASVSFHFLVAEWCGGAKEFSLPSNCARVLKSLNGWWRDFIPLSFMNTGFLPFKLRSSIMVRPAVSESIFCCQLIPAAQRQSSWRGFFKKRRRIFLAGGEMSQPTAPARWACVTHQLGGSGHDCCSLSYVSSGRRPAGILRFLCCHVCPCLHITNSDSSWWCAALSHSFPIIS